MHNTNIMRLKNANSKFWKDINIHDMLLPHNIGTVYDELLSAILIIVVISIIEAIEQPNDGELQTMYFPFTFVLCWRNVVWWNNK